ncbi:MAG: FAD-dependent oxidoreductase [Acetobacteraceae bacterium]
MKPRGLRTATDLVLLGAGHAQVEVLRRFVRRPVPGLGLVLIAREPCTPYSGMLPGVIRGEYPPGQACIELAPLAAAAEARLIVAEAVAIDLGARRVRLANGAAVRFDLLSIDVGGVQALPPGTGGGGGGAVPVKPIGRIMDQLATLEATLPVDARIAVVGAGAAGSELALALARRWGRTQILLVGAGREPLVEAPAAARRVVRAALAAAGIAVRSDVRAEQFEAGRLMLSDGSTEAVTAALWAGGVIGPGFLRASGLACDTSGCVRVAATLQSVSHPGVFAAGDCAAVEGAARPKAGVWAVRAGPVLAANLRRAIQGEVLRPWRPQRRALAILGLGNGNAVAWRGRWSLSGRLVARWKAWIDRRWLVRYR